MVIPEKPKNKSDINIIISGVKKAYFLLAKYTPENNAAAVTGVTLGKCGTNRKIIAITINEMMTTCVLLNNEPITMCLIIFQK